MQKNRECLLGVLITMILFLTNCTVSNQVVDEEDLLTPTVFAQVTNETSITPSRNPMLSTENGCISPLYSFSYTILQEKSESVNTINPFSPWQSETDLLFESPNEEYYLRGSEVVGTRMSLGSQEIWIKNTYSTGTNIDFRVVYSIFKPSTKTWRFVEGDLYSADGHHFYNGKLFFENNGQIWGKVTSYDLIDLNDTSVSIISRYDEKQDKFVFDEKFAQIPIYTGNYSDWTQVLEDNSSNFWFIVKGDSIYRFDQSTNNLEKTISISNTKGEIGAVLAKDNSIFLHVYNNSAINPVDEIFKYSSSDGTIMQISIPDDILLESFTSIWVDNSGRLWLDSMAWMDVGGEWSRIIAPPLFISIDEQTSVTRVKYPRIVGETSDGRIWFIGENGSYWLDFEDQQWCWYTTYQVTPIEDSDGNIWLVVGSKLYRADVNVR